MKNVILGFIIVGILGALVYGYVDGQRRAEERIQRETEERELREKEEVRLAKEAEAKRLEAELKVLERKADLEKQRLEAEIAQQEAEKKREEARLKREEEIRLAKAEKEKEAEALRLLEEKKDAEREMARLLDRIKALEEDRNLSYEEKAKRAAEIAEAKENQALPGIEDVKRAAELLAKEAEEKEKEAKQMEQKVIIAAKKQMRRNVDIIMRDLARFQSWYKAQYVNMLKCYKQPGASLTTTGANVTKEVKETFYRYLTRGGSLSNVQFNSTYRELPQPSPLFEGLAYIEYKKEENLSGVRKLDLEDNSDLFKTVRGIIKVLKEYKYGNEAYYKLVQSMEDKEQLVVVQGFYTDRDLANLVKRIKQIRELI